MASQTIVWVTLPNGFTADTPKRARLSVVVVPRLRSDPPHTLAPFDFVDWPEHCGPGKIEFHVAFAGFPPVKADIVSQPDSDQWKALFDGETFVRPHQIDATSGIFGTYPAARLHGDLKAGYQEVCAKAPLDHPSPDVVERAFPGVQTLFAPASPALLADPDLTDEMRRIRLASALFHPGVTESDTSVADELVDLSRHEAEEFRAATGRTKFVPIVPRDVERSAANRFAQLAVFHQQPRGTLPPPLFIPSHTRLDFHQMVSALGDYPFILRQLGLVIDLTVGRDDVPEAEADAPALVSVVPSFVAPPGHATQPVIPSTAYVCKRGSVFAAAPRNPEVAETVGGLLNLSLRTQEGDDQFRIVQVDVDSAGLRTLDLIGRVATARGARVNGQLAESAALPALRTHGVSIVRQSHAELLHDVLATGFQNLSEPGTGESVKLFAEDLVRGYRIDIQNAKSDKWNSLHERVGTYAFGSLADKPRKIDEGCVQPSVAQPVADLQTLATSTHDSSAPNYLSESLFVWQDWSLAVPRPGNPLPQPDPPRERPQLPETQLKFEASFKVLDNSLPRLRFGEGYRIRARAVDLAGNGLGLTEATAALAALDFVFLRFEPIVSPVPVLRSRPQGGDLVERIVLRSNHDTTPEAFTSTHPDYLNANERHIAPPKTAQAMAEMFGLFDASIGSGNNIEQTYALASREDGSLDDGALPPESGAKDPRPDPVHPEPVLKLTYLPDPSAAGVALRNLPGMPQGKVGRASDDGLVIADLPLPAEKANEVGSVVLVEFGPASLWPDTRPFRLRLAEGADVPAWNAADRVLTVFLPKGESRTVRMSSHLRDGDLRLFGIWDWMAEWLRDQVTQHKIREDEFPTRSEEFRQLSQLGLWWMLTPFRDLTLVHAVHQPAGAPTALSPSAPAKLFVNQTFAFVGGSVQVHSASTGHVDLIARWKETIDDPAAQAMITRDREAQVFSTPLPLSGIRLGSVEDSTITFDVSSGTVKYLAPNIKRMEDEIHAAAAELSKAADDFRTAVLRLPPPQGQLLAVANGFVASAGRVFSFSVYPMWRDLISEAGSIESTAPVEIPPEVATELSLIGPAAAQVREVAEQDLSIVQRTLGVRQEFGDTKHREVSYHTVATTRYGECFPPSIVEIAANITLESEACIVDVASSAPPAPPGIQYIVPAFSWTRTPPPVPEKFQSERRGALRVYLDRPWYSSGEGELLGVIIDINPSREADAFVTHWGKDPLWRSPPTTTPVRPSPDAFRNPARVENVRLHEKDVPLNKFEPFASLVTVIAYNVTVADGRCFCDIEIDPGASYYPFVRLALARYQPNSIKNTELSRVMLADFMQLAPTRAVAIVRQTADQFDVTVSGLTHQTPTDPIKESKAVGTQIRVSSQQRIAGTTDEAGWLPADDQVAILPSVDVASGHLLWQGAVTLPKGRSRANSGCSSKSWSGTRQSILISPASSKCPCLA